MALVNVSVYCITSKTTLLSWRMISSDDPDTTFRALFRETLKPIIIGLECELEKVYVGRDKECLDEADMNLNVSQVTAVFGSFIKYTVKTVQDSIKRCGIENCNICLPPPLHQEIFKTLHMLRDPIIIFQEKMNTIHHLKVYGTPTTEVHRPSSLKQSKNKNISICS